MTAARKLLVPFVTAGYPSPSGCLDLLKACAAGGADEIELGIPFSDPLADGPVIQATSQKALDRGATPADAFRLAESFREAPLDFMTYVNPVLQYGPRRFFASAARAGLRGVIVPDLPPEEAGGLRPAAAEAGVPLIFLVSPTCSEERIRRIASLSERWIYLVSLKGVTGAKFTSDISSFVRRVRRLTERPLLVGFGIASPADAARAAAEADGVVVGSALLRIVESGGKPRDVERFVASLRRALDRRA